MERTKKYSLLALCTPLLAATVGIKTAHSFDTVIWRWNVDITEHVTKNAAIDINLSPTDMIFVEQHQTNIGNISAVSRVNDIANTGTSTIVTEDFVETTSEMLFIDVDYDAQLQIGSGTNDGANPMGAAKYGTDGAFTDSSLAGAQSHLALYTMLQNNPNSIDHEKSFVDEATQYFEIYAYFDELDLYAKIKGYYDSCTPGGANCMPTGDIELYRLSGDQKVFIATGTLSQQNGVDMVNTAGPGGEVKLSADIDGALEWQEVFSQIVSQRQVLIPATANALTDLPSVVSAATAVANNSTIGGNSALQLDISQLSWGGVNDQETADPSQLFPAFEGELGSIWPGEISATSTVGQVLGASASSSATAVVNNQRVGLTLEGPGEGLILADITQLSFNNVSAVSVVGDVKLNDYLNLGLVERPVAVSDATAVGNNLGAIVQ